MAPVRTRLGLVSRRRLRDLHQMLLVGRPLFGHLFGALLRRLGLRRGSGIRFVYGSRFFVHCSWFMVLWVYGL